MSATQKALSVLALGFSLAAGACFGGGRLPDPKPVPGAAAKLDHACKGNLMTHVDESEACLEAARNVEEDFQSRLLPLQGNGTDTDFEKLGLVYSAANSQHCSQAASALNEWEIELGGSRGARGGSIGYIRNNHALYGWMRTYFKASAECFQEYERAFRQAELTELGDYARQRANVARGIEGSLGNRENRGSFPRLRP